MTCRKCGRRPLGEWRQLRRQQNLPLDGIEGIGTVWEHKPCGELRIRVSLRAGAKVAV